MADTLQQLVLPPIVAQTPIVDLRTGSPTTYFQDYVTQLRTKTQDSVNALNAAVALLQSQQAQIIAQQQQILAAQQQAAHAQATADAATPTGAKSGNAMSTVDVPAGGAWIAGPQVALAGVVAGSLSIQTSGPAQGDTTAVARNGQFTGAWRVQEIIGGIETTVFTGAYSAERSRDDVGLITILYNTSDTSAPIARATSGSITYRLDINSPDVDIAQVPLYLYVRRS